MAGIRIGFLKDRWNLSSFCVGFRAAMGYKVNYRASGKGAVIFIKDVHDPTRPMGFLEGWNQAMGISRVKGGPDE